jgi:hypothetical protein
MDLLGFALFVPWAVMLLLALQWGGIEHPWDSATIIGLFCGAGGMLLVFILWEYRTGDNAMIPLPMVRIRVVWTSCMASAFMFGMQMVVSYYLPIYFQAVKGVSPVLSGVYFLPTIISMMVTAVVSGVLGEQISTPRTENVIDMTNSWKVGILSALGCWRCGTGFDINWATVNTTARNFNRKVGRLPNSPRCCSWSCSTDG